VTDFDILRARSILAGLLCAVVVTLFAIPILVVYWAAIYHEQTRPLRARRRSAWTSLGIVLFMSLGGLYQLITIIGESEPISFSMETLKYFRLPLAASGACTFLIFAYLYSKDPSKENRSEVLSLALVLYVFLAPVGLVSIYPHINPEFGGGRPTPVVLLLNNEGREVWRRLHKNYDESTDPFVTLLHEREATLVVRDNGTHYDGRNKGATIVVDKKLIRAFVPQPGPYDSNR